MFKMAEPNVCHQKTFSRLVLLVVTFCIGAHFLLEDTLLYGTMEVALQCCSTAELAYEEMEHLDDLGITARSPELVQSDTPPASPVWSLCPERQFALPVRIPPKIT